MKEKSNFEEWLDKINKEEGSEYSIYDADPVLAERYKNQCLKELNGLILSFRMKIRDEGMYSPYVDTEGFLKEYDEFFGITKERHGYKTKALYPLTPDQCIQRYNAEHTDSQIFTRELTKEEEIMYNILVKKLEEYGK